MREWRSRRPSPAMIVALLALMVALGGTAYAAQHINGGAIQKQLLECHHDPVRIRWHEQVQDSTCR